MKSWLNVAEDTDFTIYNIPFGIFKPSLGDARVGSRIGDFVIDLAVLSEMHLFTDISDLDESVFYEGVLNPFIAQGKQVTNKVRERLIELFSENNKEINNSDTDPSLFLFTASEVEMLMPVDVGDYTDFYSSIEHATNVGIMFRDPENALLPNWKHIPVGYHGRASSIVVSGTDIHRPKGQLKADDQQLPEFGPSRLMDFELEMAFITGKKTNLGSSVSMEEVEDYIFGMVIFNDLSARDIQKWEYVPLGPFLGKNFGSVVSPWVVTLEALDGFRVTGPEQKPEVLPYLKYSGKKNYDIQLEVSLQPDGGKENIICQSNFKYMYWNMCQQLVHQTVNGCNLNVGDMYASGTISGPSEHSYGSMLELSWKGTKPLKLSDGSERKFIQDHDTIIMRAFCEKDGIRVGFGESVTKILPAL